MKKNLLFKFGIIVTVFLSGYYFSSYLSGRESSSTLFVNRQHCAETGNKYATQDIKDRNYSEGRSSSFTGDGEYVYSSILNTCLYSNSSNFNTIGVSKTTYYIVDLSTNQTIATYADWQKGCDDCKYNTETLRQKSEYTKMYKDNFVSMVK